MIDVESLKLWWDCWRPHRGWLHRCACCHGRNRSVSFWPQKWSSEGGWLCGECGWGLCDFNCNGTPYRRIRFDD